MNILLGVGNTLRSDDGIGVYIAENFIHPNWKTYNCGTVPENFTGMIGRENPEILIIADAADMNLTPGDFRIIPHEKIGLAGFGTHQMDLAKIIDFVKYDAGKIILIGIQPKTTEFGDIMSDAIIHGAKKLIEIIKSDVMSVSELGDINDE